MHSKNINMPPSPLRVAPGLHNIVEIAARQGYSTSTLYPYATEGFAMTTLTQNVIFFLITCFLLGPVTALAAEPHKEIPPIVDMLQGGGAKLSSDKKYIVNDKGEIIAKETVNSYKKKSASEAAMTLAAEPGKEGAPAAPTVVFCNKKCGLIQKHCYTDNDGNIVCINNCEKELMICD